MGQNADQFILDNSHYAVENIMEVLLYIAAGVAAAAIYIILNLNHRMSMKYKDVTER